MVSAAEVASLPRNHPHESTGLLTPAGVRNQVFTVVRLREGYALAEVDAFLSRVEATLTRLLRENEELRTLHAQADERAQHMRLSPGERAARIVEIAQETADWTVSSARQEAQTILTRAREEAEETVADALERATALQREIQEGRREALDQRIRTLSTFVTDFDSQMQETLKGQIGHLHRLITQLHDPDDIAASLPSVQHLKAEHTARDGERVLGAHAPGTVTPPTGRRSHA